MTIQFSTNMELSSGHLSRSTHQWLHNFVYPQRAPWCPHLFVSAGAYLVATFDVMDGYADRSQRWPGSMPPDLELCLRLGYLEGCSWVMFDVDLEPRDVLPCYYGDTICRTANWDPRVPSSERWYDGIEPNSLFTWQGNPDFGWPAAYAGIEAVRLVLDAPEDLRLAAGLRDKLLAL